jgi:hypothetical protein
MACNTTIIPHSLRNIDINRFDTLVMVTAAPMRGDGSTPMGSTGA